MNHLVQEKNDMVPRVRNVIDKARKLTHITLVELDAARFLIKFRISKHKLIYLTL